MKIDLHQAWNLTVSALALSAGVAPQPADAREFGPVRAAPRRLLQATGTAPALAQPTTLSTVPATGGMPPMLALNGVTTPINGFNIYPPDAATCGMAAADFDAGLDYMKAAGGANSARIWGFQTMNLNSNWTSLDHAVAATQSRGMALVVALANQWGDCEPTVNDLRQFKNTTWYKGGYKQVQPGDTNPLPRLCAAVRRSLCAIAAHSCPAAQRGGGRRPHLARFRR